MFNQSLENIISGQNYLNQISFYVSYISKNNSPVLIISNIDKKSRKICISFLINIFTCP